MRAAGVPDGPAMGVALSCIPRAVKQLGREGALARLAEVAATPERFEDEVHFGALAQRLVADQREADRRFVERDAPAPFANYCGDADPGALDQMHNALRLPSAVRGALMPDAHHGYGLPIGGVLATENAVIPYAVGVDIACRMKLSVLDIPADDSSGWRARSCSALLKRDAVRHRRGVAQARPITDVLDEDWTVTPLTARLRDQARRDSSARAAAATTSSSSALLTLDGAGPRARRGPVPRAALHSGSRGAGALIASTTRSSRASCTRSCRRS